MNFISGESRNQITMLPDNVDDYVDENNSVSHSSTIDDKTYQTQRKL